MSLAHAHIRSHRAMAKAIRTQVDHLRIEAPSDHSIGAKVLNCMADAHDAAANDLEEQEKALLERIS